MRFIDSFFVNIMFIQEFLERFEKWYCARRKYLACWYIAGFICATVLLSLKMEMLGGLVLIIIMVSTGIENIIGWKHSVRRWLKICIIYNLFFTTVLSCIIQDTVRCENLMPLFIVLYLFVWVFLSLISNSKVALLVNEIVSGLVATVFTIGTYLINIALKNLPASSDYVLYYHTDEAVIQALENGEALAGGFIGVIVLEMIELFFLSFLPIIGITTMSIIMIKIKVYWMEKNKVSEPEKKMGLDDEEFVSIY